MTIYTVGSSLASGLIINSKNNTKKLKDKILGVNILGVKEIGLLILWPLQGEFYQQVAS